MDGMEKTLRKAISRIHKYTPYADLQVILVSVDPNVTSLLHNHGITYRPTFITPLHVD